jgi:hypothetical protein
LCTRKRTTARPVFDEDAQAAGSGIAYRVRGTTGKGYLRGGADAIEPFNDR